MRRASRFGLGDVLVGVFLAVLIGTAAAVVARHDRAAAQRANCASNLHQIGLAILLYQQDNNQLYPRTVLAESPKPRPTWGTPYDGNKELGSRSDADPFADGPAKPADNDVSAAFFLLLRNEQISPAVFACPSSKAVRWDLDGGTNTAQNWTNWPSAKMGPCLSYSYQNPYPTTAALESGYNLKNPDPTFAVAADMNPGGPAVTRVTPQSSADELKAANSLNHDRDGQNVLYGDGHVEWQNTPFCGTKHDNIYTAGGPELDEPGRGTAAVAKASVSGTDSVLLPTAQAVGYGPPMSDGDRAKLAAAVVGTYETTTVDGKHATLKISPTRIRCSTGPVKIEFDYTVAGDNGLGLTLDLTAPETAETATLTLDGDELTFGGGGKYNLDFGWRRQPPAK